MTGIASISWLILLPHTTWGIYFNHILLIKPCVATITIIRLCCPSLAAAGATSFSPRPLLGGGCSLPSLTRGLTQQIWRLAWPPKRLLVVISVQIEPLLGQVLILTIQVIHIVTTPLFNWLNERINLFVHWLPAASARSLGSSSLSAFKIIKDAAIVHSFCPACTVPLSIIRGNRLIVEYTRRSSSLLVSLPYISISSSFQFVFICYYWGDWSMGSIYRVI